MYRADCFWVTDFNLAISATDLTNMACLKGPFRRPLFACMYTQPKSDKKKILKRRPQIVCKADCM